MILRSNARWASQTDAISAIARRTADDQRALIERGGAEPVGDRQEDGDDHELARFDAEVEGDQRDQQRFPRQPEVGEHRRETEAVDQAEAKAITQRLP